MDKNGLSAFLLGLGVGVGIGMLFAPKSGQETRDMLRAKAGEGSEFLKQLCGKFPLLINRDAEPQPELSVVFE